jgi:signal transduction histidine kinase
LISIFTKIKSLKIFALGKAFFGPWPIYPLQITILFAMASSLAGIKVAQSQNLLFFEYWRQEIVPTLITVASVFLILAAAKKVLALLAVKFSGVWSYLFVVVVSGIAFQLIQNLLIDTTLSASVLLIIRNIFAVFILSALFGYNYKKLQLEVEQKSKALLQLEAQRELIVEADEKARREVANFLHDNVQANLVVFAIELRKISAALKSPHNNEINSVIDEIDDLRSLDIRLASRKLSPDIAAIGLAATLEELFHEYRNTISINLKIENLSIPNDLALGIYRIVEQALLNAAIHGKAHICHISIDVDAESKLTLKISNDGTPLPESRVNGTGIALIESWVQKLLGSWSLESANGKTVLTAIFPLGS